MIFRTLLVTSVLALLIPAQTLADESVAAPDWTLAMPDGTAVTLSDEVADQTTVLFFWATWCPYCKALMPHLQSIRFEYGDDVRILAINIKEDGDPVEFITNAGYDFTLLLNGDAVAEQYGVKATPGIFIVDSKRNLRFDLRDLPRVEPPDIGKPPGHSRRAAYRAPHWAAGIRKSIDAVIDGQERSAP